MEFKTAKFKTFLRKSGAIILEPTNPYELVRFKTKNGVSVVYTGKRGLSFTGESREAYDTMMSKNAWNIIPDGLKEKKKTLSELIERDGPNCFYCGEETDDESRSIEHLLSVDHGGNNHLSNLVVSCRQCNVAVGNMPIIEKVKYREAIMKEQSHDEEQS